MHPRNSHQNFCGKTNRSSSGSDYNDYVNLVDEFSKGEFAISSRDIAISLDNPADFDILFEMLSKDKRFFRFGNEQTLSQVQFLPKRLFIRKLWKLNMRVSELGLKKMSYNMFFTWISTLFPIPLSARDRVSLLNWIKKYLLAIPEKSDIIFFPNADLISKIGALSNVDLPDMLSDIVRLEPDQNALINMIKEHLKAFFKTTLIAPRNLKIVLMRLGLKDGTAHTLEDIGKRVGLTREAVRLVEDKFWSKIPKKLEKGESLIKSLLCIIIKSQGGRIFVKAKNIFFNQLRFVCCAVKISFLKSERLNIYFFGVELEIIKQLESFLKNPKCINSEYVCLLIDEIKGLLLTQMDKKAIASIVSKKVRRSIDLPEIIYLGFEKIGRPAHYTEIAKACWEIFPERSITPRNLLAVLCRNPESQFEESPWVWTGSRGVYALREWGYKRPKLGLHDTVFEIVKKKYLNTGKPVAFSVLCAEIGKYRQIIKESSLILSCYCNDKITVVGRDQFVPFVKTKSAKREVNNIDKLDRKLRALDRIQTRKS